MSTAAATDRPAISSAPARRRFRLVDGMILVAATAMGFGLGEWIARESGGFLSWSALFNLLQELFGLCAGRNWAAVAYGTVLLLFLIVWLTIPLAAMWTLALIPMRLLGPRPRFRRLARQPGLVAAGAASVTFALIGLFALVALLEAEIGASEVVDSDGEIAAYLVPMLVGWAVAVAWMTLLIGRCWRAESSWIDRLGRIAGVCWIVVGFATTCLFLIDPLVRTNSFPGTGVPTAVIVPGGDGADGPPGL